MKKKLSLSLAVLMLVSTLLTALPLTVFAADPALQKTALELYVGETDKLEVQNAAAAVTWSSADARIVEVAADGTLTAKAVGQTTVTAKTGGKTLTCTVYVVEKEYDFNDQIMISAFWPPDPEHTTEEQYQLMEDAGINLIMTFSGCPSPIMLLTRVLHVAENACRTTQISPDTLRVMFEMARALSPRCSMYRKNMNHVEIDIVFCIMVQEHTGIMPLSSAASNLAALSRPNFFLSHLTAV